MATATGITSAGREAGMTWEVEDEVEDGVEDGVGDGVEAGVEAGLEVEEAGEDTTATEVIQQPPETDYGDLRAGTRCTCRCVTRAPGGRRGGGTRMILTRSPN